MTADRRDLRLPEFAPAAVTRLINKRDHKFRLALFTYLEECAIQVRYASVLASRRNMIALTLGCGSLVPFGVDFFEILSVKCT